MDISDCKSEKKGDSAVRNSNNNRGCKPVDGEPSSSNSADRISNSNSTPAPGSGAEVSEFHSVEDVSIFRTNSKTHVTENANSNKELATQTDSNLESTIVNNTAIQTDFPQMVTPFPQRNK